MSQQLYILGSRPMKRLTQTPEVVTRDLLNTLMCTHSEAKTSHFRPESMKLYPDLKRLRG